MHLLKLGDLLKLTGNSPDVMNPTAVQHCLPDRKDSTNFLRFPFSDTGLRLNLACTDLFLFDHLWFKFKEGRDNALREPIEDRGAYKTVLLYVDEYLMLKNDVMNPDLRYRYTQWLGGDHLDFFGYWMLRNKQSPVVQVTTIVDTKVTTCIQNFFNKNCMGDKQDGCPISQKNIHLYLMNNLDILYKKFVFFPLFEGGNHWSGWAAVNPWVQLARVLYQHGKRLKRDKKAYKDLRGYGQRANGLIACDGLHTKTVSHTRQIIWFLNLASPYCDMVLEKKIDYFNYLDHTPRTYFMLGCSGPFGILDVKDNSMITYKILSLHQSVRPIQTDGSNCGLVWCLFVYDMMLQFGNSYHNILPHGSRELLLKLGIGKTWLHPWIFSALTENKTLTRINNTEKFHYQQMCNNLREELVCLLERLHLLRLQSFSNKIEKPQNWGNFCQVFTSNLINAMKKTIMKIPGKNEVAANLRAETKL